MDADLDLIKHRIKKRAPMRVGRKLRRTIYLTLEDVNDPDLDLCVGIVDSEALAEEIVRRWNTQR